MVRSFISTMVLVAVAAAYTLAAERATFILTTGERIKGDVIYRDSANFVNGQLNLGGAGKERSFAIDQVAVIDFDDGTPSPIELSRVAQPNAGQAVVLRNGHAQAGKFVNIVTGDVLVWENARGEQERYPLREVTRVYLNPQRAQAVFRNPPAPTTDVGAGVAPGQAAPPFRGGAGSVRVHANVPWNDTGMTVRAGDQLTFQASGQIQFGESPGQNAGSAGNAGTRSPNYPVSALPAGALIGKVGDSAPFAIGSNTASIRMPAEGRLFLGVNDNELNDNSGYFSVTIARQ